jgi:hypothetical protein
MRADDPTIARLAPEEREALAVIWWDRARAESAVCNVFAQVADELTASGAPAELVALARRAEADEARHAAICEQLAIAYGHDSTPRPERRVRLRDYDQPTVRLRAALHAIHVCCISETIATVFVEACLGACESQALREIHREHLADEVQHARVGWAYAATLSADERAAVASELPAVLELQLAAWTARINDLPVGGVAGHGYPPRSELLDAVHGAIRELVLPGFDHVGVDSAAARAWYAARAI